MVTDQIGDLLTRIRNAQGAGHPSVNVPASKTKAQILEVLQDEGYIASYQTVKNEDGKPQLKVMLRYDTNGVAVIRELKRISRPGKRQYVSTSDIPWVKGGLGVVVISTSKGMMSDRTARKEGHGGELICSVF